MPPILNEDMQAASCWKTSGWRRCSMALILAVVFLLIAAAPAVCSEAAMKGPGAMIHRHSVGDPGPETSTVRLVFLGAIDVYRSRISPTQGQRCGFYPTCSAFGRQAVSEYGALQGVLMTADRLTRCNIFKEAGPDYFLLPGGRLFDPVSANILIETK